MANILDSFLVDLGFTVNQASFQKFNGALKAAQGSVGTWTSQISRAFGAQEESIKSFIGSANVIASTTAGMVEDILKFQGAVVGVFTAASTAILGMVDKLAMADQGYRLFGLHMMMNEEAAKRLKIAQDALGASLGEIVWDPELHKNFLQLQEDQEAYQKSQGEGFAAAMRGWRNLHFEIERVKIGLLYLAQSVVARLFETMGVSIDTVTAKIHEFLAVLQNPEQFRALVDKISGTLVPILLNTWEILKGIGQVIYQAGVAFQNLIGIISGDKSLEGTSLTFDSITKSIKTVIGGILWFEGGIIKAEKVVLHFINALLDLKHLNFKGFGDELMAAIKDISAIAAGIIGTLIGTLAGGVIGFLIGGPPGALLGMGIGAVAGGVGGYNAGKLKEILSGEITYDEKGNEIRKGGASAIPGGPGAGGNADIVAKIRAEAQRQGLDENLALAIARQESSFRQYDEKTGGVLHPSQGGHATGVFMLEPQTAREMGVNAENTDENIRGGIGYFIKQLNKFGDTRLALEAYNAGPGAVEASLKYGQALKPDVSAYADRAIRNSGNVNVGDVHINITNPKSAEEAHRGAQEGVTAAFRKQAQYDIAMGAGR
jgi:Transglycosylase SLT domain